MGISLDEMVVWNPFRRLGGNTPEQLCRAKMVSWQGHCSVHTRFTTSQIDAARALYPDINIIVQPECPMETVEAAGRVGSTEFIREQVNSAPPGSKWGIGTEVSLVNRLAINNPDKTVFCLDPVTCPCSTMYRIHPAYLLWMLYGLLEGKVNNEITPCRTTLKGTPKSPWNGCCRSASSRPILPAPHVWPSYDTCGTIAPVHSPGFYRE